MVSPKHGRVILFGCVSLFLTGFIAGCGEEDGNKAVRESVEKSSAASSSGGNSAFGKVSNETKLPPQGKPPEPGTNMSSRGNSGRPAQ